MDYMKLPGILGLMVMSRHWREDSDGVMAYMQRQYAHVYQHAVCTANESYLSRLSGLSDVTNLNCDRKKDVGKPEHKQARTLLRQVNERDSSVASIDACLATAQLPSLVGDNDSSDSEWVVVPNPPR